MPTFEEMQRESSERLVAFAKYAKLSVRGALLEGGYALDGISVPACNVAVNFLMTDYVALSAHKWRGEGARPLAQDIREPLEEMSAILDGAIREKGGVVDKRRMALAIVNKAVLEDTRVGRDSESMEELAAELNAVRGHEHVTRTGFTTERTGDLVTSAHYVRQAMENRFKGISTLYVDDRTDNVASFHEMDGIQDEMDRLDEICFRGASQPQRQLWERGYHGVIRERSEDHLWEQGYYGGLGVPSEDLPQSDPGFDLSDDEAWEEDSNANFDLPLSGSNTPRPIDERSEHGSDSSRQSYSDASSGYDGRSTSRRPSSEHGSLGSDMMRDLFPDNASQYQQSPGAAHSFFDNWPHHRPVTLPRTFQAGRRLGASHSSRESPRSESWAGMSSDSEPGSAATHRSNRPEANRDSASSSPQSASTSESAYVLNRWPGAGQLDGQRAFQSVDRHAAVVNEQARQDLAAGRASSPNVIPETRENSPSAASSTSQPQNLKRGRSDTPDGDGSESSNKRQQLIDGRAERSSRSRGL